MESVVLGVNYPDTVYEEYSPDNAEGYKDGDVIITPYTGYTVRTFKNKYDKETKELIIREEDQVSIYKKRDKVVVKIVRPTEPPTEPPAPPAAPDTSTETPPDSSSTQTPPDTSSTETP